MDAARYGADLGAVDPRRARARGRRADAGVRARRRRRDACAASSARRRWSSPTCATTLARRAARRRAADARARRGRLRSRIAASRSTPAPGKPMRVDVPAAARSARRSSATSGSPTCSRAATSARRASSRSRSAAQVVATSRAGVDDGWVRFAAPTTPGAADVTFIATRGRAAAPDLLRRGGAPVKRARAPRSASRSRSSRRVVVLVQPARRRHRARRDRLHAAGARYAEWWTRARRRSSTARSRSTQTFGGALGGGANNPEHPPLDEDAVRAVAPLLHDKLGVVDELTAFRLPSALLHGAAASWLVFAMALELWGLAEAVLAALLPAAVAARAVPRRARCFDAPIMTLWFATVVRVLALPRRPQVAVAGRRRVGARARDQAHRAAAAVRARRALRRASRGARRERAATRWRVRRVAMRGARAARAVRAVAVAVARIRSATCTRGSQFHLHHVHYNFEYLGQNWNAPRVPVARRARHDAVHRADRDARRRGASAPACGSRSGARQPSIASARRCCCSRCRPPPSIGPFLLGSTPIFGAEKHWMPALPTICIAAGVGAAWAARRARGAGRADPERVALGDRRRRDRRSRASPRSRRRSRTR